jgi:heme/copper-type cytochrome/quinol oxidase subunit 4
MFVIPISLYVLTMTKTSNTKSDTQLRTLALILAILTIFVFGSRHLINGVEEHETTSDMINIVINGYFRWSIHGSHYDLAPLDAILKVVLSYITSDTIFSPTLASIMYTCYGLVAFLLIYVLARTITSDFNYALAVTLLAMLSYPYSPLIGLSTPPAPHAHLLAVAALALVTRSLLGYRAFTLSDYFATILLVLASLLIHPSSLGLVLYLALIALWLAYRKNLTKHNYVLSVLVLSLIIYLAKVMYTAFARGFANYIQLLWDYVVNAFREMEVATIATRNPGYSGLPRVCLTGFATLLGYLAGLALPILVKALKRKQLSVVEQLLIVTLIFYGAFTLASLLTGLGGVSQTRIILNGAQPYMELALVLYLATLVPKQGKSYILIPLAISVLATLISPNALPQNYTIPMAAKAATINDHIVAYSFTELIDRHYFVQLYNTCGAIGRITAFQERGDVSYGLGSTMATVYYFIAPRVVSAKSYWDSCIMAIYAEPRDVSGYVIDRVFDAWVYGLYIYAKR